MNIHHLELFYYVARHEGISEAVRNIPYGIQQPAVSGQILQLEDTLGVKLFQRRPFQLTPAGVDLFDFIRPFFDGLKSVESSIRNQAEHLRIGASAVVLRDHLPAVLTQARQSFPGLRVTLRSGHQPQLESWLQAGEIDLAVTALVGRTLAGLQSKPLAEVPLAIAVPKQSPLKTEAALWKCDLAELPLICLPENDSICKLFQRGLAQHGLDWFPSIEVPSFELIEVYTANGDGVGLTLAVSVGGGTTAASIRKLVLTDFPKLSVGVIWSGKANAVTRRVLELIEQQAASLDLS